MLLLLLLLVVFLFLLQFLVTQIPLHFTDFPRSRQTAEFPNCTRPNSRLKNPRDSLGCPYVFWFCALLRCTSLLSLNTLCVTTISATTFLYKYTTIYCYCCILLQSYFTYFTVDTYYRLLLSTTITVSTYYLLLLSTTTATVYYFYVYYNYYLLLLLSTATSTISYYLQLLPSTTITTY